MRKRTRFLLFLVAAILLAFILSLWALSGGEAKKQDYKLAKVQKGKILAIVSSTGTVNPLNTVQIGSQVSGNIKEILVDFNSPVKKGQVLATIDPAVYSAQVEQAKAQLMKARAQLLEVKKDIQAARAGIRSAQAQVESARATLKEAESQFNRLARLVDKKSISRSEYDATLAKRDNARGSLKIAQAKLETAKAQLSGALAAEKGVRALIEEREAALNLAQVRLNYCTIKSPIDGVVISRNVDVGQTVAATLQSPVLFTIAEDLTRMQVEVDVSEADVGQIHQGQQMEFTVDAFPDKKFRATVRQVRNYPTNIQNVITYKVIADVRNDQQLLRPGMTANATITVAQEEGVLKVPNAALRFRPLGQVKEEARPAKAPAAKDTQIYKNTVKNLKLDAAQAKQFERIMEEAAIKLKSSLQTATEDEDRRAAWKTYFTQVFMKLREILREDQLKIFYAYAKKLREARDQRKNQSGRPGQVYVLDPDGRPKLKKVLVGISNETETQIIRGDIQEGESVIVGLASLSTGSSGRSSFLSSVTRMFGRR